MTYEETLIAVQAIVGAVVALGVFLVWLGYGIFFEWTKRRAGRAFFYLLTALSFSFIGSIITLWVGPDWGNPEWELRRWASILILAIAAFAIIKTAIALVENWRKTGRVLDLEARARHAQAVLDETDPEWRTRK